MNKPKNILKYIAYVVLAIALGLGIYFGAESLQQTDGSTNNTVESSKIAEPEVKDDYVTYSGIEGENALATLKTTNDQVVTKDSEYGEYVDSINGLVGGTDGKYWSFYIDGELSDVGAGSYVAKGGEKFEWKFINLQ